MAKTAIETGLEQAAAQMQVGQWRAAKKTYQRLLKQTSSAPESAEALIGLAKLAQADSKFRESCAYLDRLIQEQPNYLPGLLLAIQYAFQAKDSQRAQSLSEQTLERYPRQLDVLKLTAQIFESSDPRRSQQILEQLLSWYPEQEDAYLDLLPLYLQNGELQLAVQLLESIDSQFPELQSDPRYIDLHQTSSDELTEQASLIFEKLILERETP